MGNTSNLHAKLWKIFSQWVRLSDCIRTTFGIYYGCCISCGRAVPFAEAHAGHFIPCAAKAIEYERKNVHLQCIPCNIDLRGNVEKYAEAIDQLYGSGTAEELKSRKNELKQWREPELLELIDFYTSEVNTLKNTYL